MALIRPPLGRAPAKPGAPQYSESARRARERLVAALARSNRGHCPTFGIGDLELLDQLRFEELLNEPLALLTGGWKVMRLPARDEVAPAHVRESRLGPLPLPQPAPPWEARRGWLRAAQN